MPEFTIESPPGVPKLDIRFGGDYSELYFGDQPLALTWSIADGSVLDHLIQFAHADGRSVLELWRSSLQEGSAEIAVVEVARHTLASGFYRTFVTDFYHVDACLSECSTDIAHPTVFYGGCFSLVTTLAPTALSEERISHYEELISSGQRPLGVALCCYDQTHQQPTTAFLVDGHHKVAAYQRCRLHSHVLMVARCHTPQPNQPYPIDFQASRLGQ